MEVSPIAIAVLRTIVDGPFNSFQWPNVSVPALIVRVLTNDVKPIAATSTPPLPATAIPNVGSPGTSASRLSPAAPEILHLVSGDNSKAFSSSRTFAARPETCTVAPSRFGTTNETGDALLVAPNCHAES